MIAANHELSAFAVVTLAAAGAGVRPVGALLLGALGAWAGDWPDIDHAGARVTKSLRWVPYWRHHPRDAKTGDYKRRKDGRVKTVVRWFPSWQVHRFFCWLSAWIYDRCATPADRRDTAGSWGPAFRVHRGFSHSVWCAGFTGALWWAVLAPWSIWEPLNRLFGVADVPVLVGCTVALGMVAHVAGDACTDFGVAPFAPVIKVGGRRYPRMGLWEPMRFKVSKSVERLVIGPLCTLAALFAVAGALWGPQRVLEAVGAFGADVWAGLA